MTDVIWVDFSNRGKSFIPLPPQPSIQPSAPRMGHLDGLSPIIMIPQKTIGSNFLMREKKA